MATAGLGKKILYLDFDGVLHHEAVYYHPRRGIYMGAAGHVLFEWTHILDELLCPYPEVLVVLSTSWVRHRSYDYAKSNLSRALQERVIGATFHRREMRKEEFVLKPRGVQIAEDVARRKPLAWFAIDDDALYWPGRYSDKLILTDGALGISDPTVQESIRAMLERL